MNTNQANPPSTGDAATSDHHDAPETQRRPVRHKEGLESNTDHRPDDAAGQQQQ